MKEYIFRTIKVSQVILVILFGYLILAGVLLAGYNLLLPKLVAAILFAVILALLYFLLIKRSEKVVKIRFKNLWFEINEIKYDFEQLKNYNFEQTKLFYKCRIQFSSKTIKFTVRKKHSHDYIAFKKHFLTKINQLNQDNNLAIKEVSWFKTKWGQLNGYILSTAIIVWMLSMILRPDKLSWSNFSLFVFVVFSSVPILVKIFRKV